MSRTGSVVDRTATLSATLAPSDRRSQYPTQNTPSEATMRPIPTGPLPTFHSLTNFRFPLGTPAQIVEEYEEVCRLLFVTLGRRGGRTGEEGDEEDGFDLAKGIGTGLERMARLLEKAGVIGPLISLLSLISYLVLLFPFFSLYFLNHPRLNHNRGSVLSVTQETVSSSLLSFLGSVIKRFGRPAPVVRIGNNSNRGKAKERSRKIRGIVTKPVLTTETSERVELDPEKRAALLLTAMDVIEGLAWRIDEAAEDQ
jgi:hypothetical protein